MTNVACLWTILAQRFKALVGSLRAISPVVEQAAESHLSIAETAASTTGVESEDC